MQTIIKTYPKSINGSFKRSAAEAMLKLRGYYPVAEEEIKQYSGGKGLLLGLLFLPLALLGGRKYIKVTYEKRA